MVQVSEGVPQVLDRVLQALDQVVTSLVIIHHKFFRLLVNIVGQIGLLVLSQHCGCAIVRTYQHLLLSEILCNVGLHLFEEWSGLLDINVEFGKLRVKLVSVLIGQAFWIRLGGITQSLEKLVRGKFDHLGH